MAFRLLSILTLLTLSSSHIINKLKSTNLTLRASIEADRTYYIAAVDIDWDYAPNASNPFTGIAVDDDETASVYTLSGINRIGSIYRKAVYREYTDSTFTTLKERDSSWQHLGILGPPIRAIVGERIKIYFFNNASSNYSMHPHGVKYNALSEGALYQTHPIEPNLHKSIFDLGTKVEPGQTWIYIWDARDNTAGSTQEFTSKFWFYHSHINEPMDTNSGLVGPILITKKGYATDSANNNLVPTDVDREFVTLFTVFNENMSWYLKYNLMKFAMNDNGTKFTEQEADDFDYEDEDFQESNLMHSMNGYEWNVLGKYMNNIKIGEKVRWYIGGMGTEVDIHTAHWHGNIIVKDGFVYEDVVQLMPAYSTTVDMYVENPGSWFYHCHVNDHVEAGMIATYTVINETCTDCVGASTTDNSASDNKDEFGNILADDATWIIAVISFILNWFGLLMVYMIYRFCCNGNRMFGKRYGDVRDNELRESMLEMK